MQLNAVEQTQAAPTGNTARAVIRAMARWEWPTLGVYFGTIAIWCAALIWAGGAVSLVLLVVALTLHSSLSHEFLHGGPFRSVQAATVLGLIQPGLFVPYLRFRALHLAHHRDARLTDPYDDPESNYLEPDIWERLPEWRKSLLRINNTLAGRMAIGPALGMFDFVRGDLARIRAGDRGVAWHWVLHLPGCALTLALVGAAPLSVWTYLAACYGALSVLKIRTFLEHQAHARVSARTVVVEDRGPLALLFLNNNFHVVHHMHPQMPWYRLPALYAARRDRFLRCNQGYVYRSYHEVFRRYLIVAKDPVAHPLWRGGRD